MCLGFFFLFLHFNDLSTLAVDLLELDVEDQSGTAGDGTGEAASTVAVVAVELVS